MLIRLFPLNWEEQWIESRIKLCQRHLQHKCSHLTSGNHTRNLHRTRQLGNRIYIWETSTKSRRCSSSSPHLQRLLWEEVTGEGKPQQLRAWAVSPTGHKPRWANSPWAPWHTHLQLFDHSFDEVSAEFHPLQALLSQTDGVENRCCDFVCIFCL